MHAKHEPNTQVHTAVGTINAAAVNDEDNEIIDLLIKVPKKDLPDVSFSESILITQLHKLEEDE